MSEYVLPGLPDRKADAHKNDVGKLLVIAGSGGMTGAGALACMAALRGGAGVVTWAVPKSLCMTAELLVLETITLPVAETQGQSPGVDSREYLVEAALEVDAVVLGPGLPAAGETGELLRLVIPEIKAPLVLDAGALSAVGKDWKIVAQRKGPTVITPHAGEMARLVGKNAEEVQANREGIAKKYAAAARAVVLLKGKDTVVTDAKRVYVNGTGNPGMATAGSGDVLSGLIGALLCQGLDVFDAACLGAHLHGLAGDIAAADAGIHGLIAGDIVASLPESFIAYASDGGECECCGEGRD